MISERAAEPIQPASRMRGAARASRQTVRDEVTLLGDVVAPVVDVQASAGAAAGARQFSVYFHGQRDYSPNARCCSSVSFRNHT